MESDYYFHQRKLQSSMEFKLIDVSTWARREYFEYYLNEVSCTYSITFNLDVTLLLNAIKQQNIKLYPAMIYLISKIVNQHEEFRMFIDSEGNVGVFDLLHPSYTVLRKDGETFTNIWTEYTSSFTKFYEDYLLDVQNYSEVQSFIAKPNVPLNVCNLSSVPWVSFTGLNLNLPKINNYLLPIFTMGKFFEQNGKHLLPFAIQAHHAVCDGFHIGRFVAELQEAMDSLFNGSV